MLEKRLSWEGAEELAVTEDDRKEEDEDAAMGEGGGRGNSEARRDLDGD